MTMEQALRTAAETADRPRLSKTRKGFMNVSRQFLLAVLAFGLQAGLVFATEPAANSSAGPTLPSVSAAPVNGAATVPTSVAASTAAPANLPAGISAIQPTGLTCTPPQLGCTVDTHCPSCCCGASGQGGLIGGVGLYLVQPYFQDNMAYGVLGLHTADIVDIRQHMDVAPLIWLGYLTDDGWGGRARYWYLRDGTSQTLLDVTGGNVIASAAPLGLSTGAGSNSATVTSELEMQFLDLEGLADLRSGCWDFLFSTGLRLARIDQTYNFYGTTILESNHSFDGVGPTIALETRCFLGSSGLALYGSARGSVVFGSADQEAVIPLFGAGTADHRDRGLAIGELELGLEYDRRVGNARLFGQIAFVGQDWGGAGNSSRSVAHLPPINQGASGQAFQNSGISVDSDIALLGVCFRIGINY
jgi:hypothetical protein